MTRAGANNLLNNLRTYYPRSFYFKGEEDITAKIDDYEKSFSKWDDEIALEAAYNWHLEHSESPTVADLIKECRLAEMEKQPYTPVPKQEEVKSCPNPWQKALDKFLLVREHNPNDPHNILYYIITEYSYDEYLRAKEIWLNCKNRRNEENRRLGIDEVDDRICEAIFADDADRENIRKRIRSGELRSNNNDLRETDRNTERTESTEIPLQFVRKI